MAESPITLDVSAFPLVIHTFRSGHTDADVERMLAEYDVLLRGERRYAIVVDFRASAAQVTPAQRKVVKDWWLSRKPRIEQLNVLSVVVTHWAWARAALTAIYWFTQPRNPQKSAATVAEALDLCMQALEREGIGLSPSLVAQVRRRYASLCEPS